jgi:hypothetical protein
LGPSPGRAFRALVALSFAFAAISLSLLSFLRTPAAAFSNPVALAFCVGPWILMLVLAAIHPWATPQDPIRSARFPLVHASFAVLAVAAVAALASTRRTELALAEGERVPLVSAYGELGLSGAGEDAVELEYFSVGTAGSVGQKRLYSMLSFNSGGNLSREWVETNHPIAHGGLDIYQKGWNVGVESVEISLGNEIFSFNEKIAIPLMTGERFLIRVTGYDGNLRYRWALEGNDGLNAMEGEGDRDGLEAAFGEPPLRVVMERFRLFSVLEIWRKPLSSLLASASVLFILSLVADSLLGIVSKRGKRASGSAEGRTR